MPRLNTQLEATGAEFLVLGNLLIRGIQAYKAYLNNPGFDLLAVNPDTNRSCRIQVKSRYATDYGGGFPISNFDCDFVVFVALNRGYRYSKVKKGTESGIEEPCYYVFPIGVIQDAQNKDEHWNKVHLRYISNIGGYLNAWHLIANFLLH